MHMLCSMLDTSALESLRDTFALLVSIEELNRKT